MENKKYGFSKFEVVKENGVAFVLHIYKDEIVDKMKVYGIGKKPYVRRLMSKIYLDEDMIKAL